MREGLSWRWLALILFAFCFPLFIGLGGTDLENDEAIYSYAVDSILETGDWLSPRSSPTEDRIFLEKPPLKFWIVAAPIRLGLLPHDERGLRFWDALFGSAAFVYVFLLGRRLGGPLCGAVAVLVLFAQHRLLFDHGLRSNNMDAALVLTYSGGAYHFIRYADVGQARRLWHMAAVAGLFYLGFMSKFVAALFLPIVLLASALQVGEWRRLVIRDRWRWMGAGAAVFAAVVPWFAYQHVESGGKVFDVLIGEHVYKRFTTYSDPEHVQPWYFYFAEAFRQFRRSGAAWLVALGVPVLLGAAFRRRVPVALLAVTWFVLPIALISCGTSKLYHYLFPYLPPLALAAGQGVAWVVSAIGPAIAAAWERRFHPPFRPPRLASAILLVMALAAAALALATAAQGHVRFEVAGTVLFRNSSVARPALAAALCAVMAGHVGATLLAAAILAIALVVPSPLAGYLASLEELTVERHPLRTLSACLQEVDAQRRAAGETVRGVYGLSMIDGGFLHQYFFYLRRAGGWEERSFDAADEAIVRALFVSGQERPVALESRYYSEFLARRGSGPSPAAVHFGRIVVALPGPYNRCAAAGAGGRS